MARSGTRSGATGPGMSIRTLRDDALVAYLYETKGRHEENTANDVAEGVPRGDREPVEIAEGAPVWSAANISNDTTTTWFNGAAARTKATETAAISYAGTDGVDRSIHVIKVMTVPPRSARRASANPSLSRRSADRSPLPPCEAWESPI